MPLGECFQIAVEGKVLASGGAQRKVVNSFTYRRTLFNVADNLAAYWAVFSPQVWQPLAALLPSGADGWVGVQAWGSYVLDGVGPPSALGVPASGTGPVGRLPLNQSIFINLATAQRGRQFSGNKRIGPVAISHTTGDELTPGGRALWAAAAAPILQPLVIVISGLTNIYVPVAWSRLRWPPNSFISPDDKSDLISLHVNLTLGQWKHRRERVVR